MVVMELKQVLKVLLCMVSKKNCFSMFDLVVKGSIYMDNKWSHDLLTRFKKSANQLTFIVYCCLVS